MCDERSPSANLERRSTDDAALKIEDEVARDVGCDARKESGALVGAQFEVANTSKQGPRLFYLPVYIDGTGFCRYCHSQRPY